MKVTTGIDVSHWQGKIDFNKVKNAGMDFVIIKAGGSDAGYYQDSNFVRYYEDAVKAGLKVGAYYFVGQHFANSTTGKIEASRFLDIVKGKTFDFPLYCDIETTPTRWKEAVTDAALTFCECVRCHGYKSGIYGSDVSTFHAMVNYDRIKPLKEISLWVAKYSVKPPSFVKRYDIWQYSGSGSCPGINGKVDIDKCYVEFTQSDAPSESETDVLTRVAEEVIDGKWGNGSERAVRLKDAGYDYTQVQARVNDILKGRKNK